MSVLEAIILGLVQGLTEFLPISSSGHLVIAQGLLGLNQADTNLSLVILLHLASLLAVVVVFFEDISKIFSRDIKTLVMIILGTIPAVVVGLLLEESITSLFSSNYLMIGICLWITAVYLLVGESFWRTSPMSLERAPLTTALWVGLAQAIAIIPGISRSGFTISTGFITGLDKKDAVRFSFFLAIPIILGATVMKLKHFDKLITSFQPIPILVGFVVCFFVSLLAINLLINVVKKGQLYYFAIYCFIIGFISIIMSL
ncbi:undecaprenyl-diphosphate phosphatase [Planctomycetota bacterium]